jgi:hypothetical protein
MIFLEVIPPIIVASWILILDVKLNVAVACC